MLAQSNLVVSGPTSNSPGSNNTYFGVSTSTANSSQYNVLIGSGTGSLNGGTGNSYLGAVAGLRTTTASENTYIGYWAGYSLNGNQNVAIGRYAGYGGGLFSDLTRAQGSFNVYVGASAGYKGYPNGASYNVMIGDSAGYNNVVGGNTSIGAKAGFTNQSGLLNTYLGYQSGYNAVADSNTFVGYKSGFNATAGKGNTFLGVWAGQSVSTGSHNTIIGNGAGPISGDGDNNVYMGYSTGNRDKGSRNTFLGTGADALVQNLANATAIGAGAEVSVSNAVVLGKEANVGIGTSAPTARLHIRSAESDQSGIRFENLTSQSPVVAKTGKVLSVDAQGNVILVEPQQGRLTVPSVSDWADRVFEPSYKLRSIAEVARFVRVNKHLPDFPAASEVTSKGYEAATMDAHLLQKVEETMLYVIQLKEEMNQLRQENRQLKKALHHLKKH